MAKLTRGYRRRCEDRVDVIDHPAGVVLVVADGAGGSGGGAEAADAIVGWARAHATAADIRPAGQWADLLAKADRQISFANGETTAVIVSAWEDGLSGASVGDSAAWLVRENDFDSLTAGQHHKPLLGSGHAKPVPFERPALSGDTLLLASDGLVKYAPPARICDVARQTDLDAAAAALVDLVRLRSGQLQDDVAVVLCRRRTSSATPPARGRKRYTLADDGDLLEEEAE